MISIAVVDALTPHEVLNKILYRRYVRGDWGNIIQSQKDDNDRYVRDGVSEFSVVGMYKSSSKPLCIMTNLAQKFTAILFMDEGIEACEKGWLRVGKPN